MKHFLLFYDVAGDFAARRGPHRETHLKLAWEASACGELVLAGALAEPIDGAVLLFRGESSEVAERFARADPYVTSGAVTGWRVREWTTVVGDDASMSVRPPGVEAPREIVRMWKARATVDGAAAYARYATAQVFPKLREIEGHRGGYLLRRAVQGAVEVMVVTLWESMTAVRRFAGAKVAQAVVEPEARAVLTDVDETVTHYEVEAKWGR